MFVSCNSPFYAEGAALTRSYPTRYLMHQALRIAQTYIYAALWLIFN